MAEGGIVGQVAQATASIPVIGSLPPMVRVVIVVLVVALIVLIILQCVFHMVDILPFCKKEEKAEQTSKQTSQQSTQGSTQP